MLDRNELIKELKEICIDYSDIIGLVILFGSYSRDEANEDSDIDLYIEPKDEKMTTAKLGTNRRYKDFKYTLYSKIPKNFDLLSYGGVKDSKRIKSSPLWEQINKDGVLIYDQRAKAV